MVSNEKKGKYCDFIFDLLSSKYLILVRPVNSSLIKDEIKVYQDGARTLKSQLIKEIVRSSN